MSFLDTIIDGVKGIAPLAANYILPGSGSLVENVLRSVTGEKEKPIEDLAKEVSKDPELYIKFKSAVMDHESTLAEIELKGEEIKSKRIESVNRTMRVEAKSEKWAQYTWRPYNGFMFGTTFFCVHFLLPLINGFLDPRIINGKAVAAISIPEIAVGAWVIWGSVLGVTSWHRGKEKRTKAGEIKDGGFLSGVIKTIRGN